jgi:hypothetical protein
MSAKLIYAWLLTFLVSAMNAERFIHHRLFFQTCAELKVMKFGFEGSQMFVVCDMK